MVMTNDLPPSCCRRERLFCYGTLQIPAVLEAVIGRRLEGEPAKLSGYSAFRIHRAEYPGLACTPGAKTAGRLYRDLTAGDLDILDRFEGRLYHRKRQWIALRNGRHIQAWIYLVAPGQSQRVTATPWNLDRFRQTDYRRFMQRFVMDRRASYASQPD